MRVCVGARLIGANLSEPHISEEYSDCVCVWLSYVQPANVCWVCPLQFARSGMHIVTCLDGQNWLPHMNRFALSLPSASNDHCIERNDSSSPTLPIINDIWWKIGNTSDYYSCMVYALQFQDTPQRAWLKHSNREQIVLACRHSEHGVSCVHGVRVAATHCVCCCPRLQSLAAYCGHSICTCNAQLGSPHNAVHSSSISVHACDGRQGSGEYHL